MAAMRHRCHALDERDLSGQDAAHWELRLNSLCLMGVTTMPRVNRVEIFADDEVQVFHLVNRCVRRTYLCGRDEETGRDYSHRKQWK